MPNSSLADSLFDLKKGSTWTYEVVDVQKYKVVNKVSAVKNIRGVNWYKLIEYEEVFWVRNSERGQIEAVNFVDISLSQTVTPVEVLIYKYPAEKGDEWDVFGSPVRYQGLQKVTVPAGSFNCHMYFFDMGNSNYSKTCIAKDIGVVYNENVLNNKTKEVSKLIAYK